MDKLKELWTKIKPHYIWYVLGTIVALYATSFTFSHFTSFTFLAAATSQLAATIIAGGVFASLLKSYQFSELFKDELEKLFLTDKFVDRMKIIARHGEAGDQTLPIAFERLAAASHPALASAVPDSIKTLLPIKSEYSFRTYHRYIKILGYAKASQTITIEDEVEYEIDVHASTTYKSSVDGVAFADRPNIKAYTLNERGGATTCVKQQVHIENNHMSLEIPVTAGKIYTLHRVVETKFPLFKDPNIHQQFQRFCHGLQLEIENQVSSQISFTVQWINFDSHPVAAPRTDQGGSTVCRYQNHGLTFPYQGFILTMSPNK